MRILHVYSGNLFGGIESMLVACAGVAAAASDVEQEFALCFDERCATELRAVGRLVHLLGPVRMSRPVTAHAARQALDAVLRRTRFDAVICHAPWAQAIFGGVVRRRGVLLVFWAHDRMTGRHWTERLARHVPPNLVICNSAFTHASQPALYPGRRAAVVYPAVRVGAPLRQRRHVRMSLETPLDAIVIVQASRCEPWKGHQLLLDALAVLHATDGWMLWMVGGPQRPHEQAFLSQLQASAVRAGVADRVRWLGQRPDVSTVLAAADLYCQPNLEPEPFGVSFVEALAAGLPVVSVAQGGVCEIVDDTCGRLVTPRSVEALAEALRLLMTDAARRAALAAAAPDRARTVSDPLTQVTRLRAALASATGRLELAG